jgi:hypothetical protein
MHPNANHCIQIAIALTRNAFVLVNEGEGAKVPTPEAVVRIYAAIERLNHGKE